MPSPIYLNNAGTSWPKAPGVVEAATAALDAQPAAGLGAFESCRRDVAALLGVAADERLLLTPGCTSALAVAIGDLPWQPDDVVLTSPLEHHALARPVEKLVRERGVVHEVGPYRPGTPLCLDHARRVLQRGRVRLVALTHASNVTGEVLPVAELAALAHEHGALVLLDAAQTFGILDVKPATLGVDLLTFAGHKGPLAPHGIGGLWAAPAVTFESPSAACEIGDGARPSPCSPMPGYCDVGSVNLAAAAGLAAALEWRKQTGEESWQRALALAARLMNELAARSDCRVLGGDGDHTATVACRLDRLPLERTEARFASAGIVVRAGQHCAPRALEALGMPEGALRFSFGPFNTDADVDAVLGVIDAL